MQTETKTEIKNEDGIYTTSAGNKLTPEEMAETLKEAIEHYNNQIKTTKDVRKKKRLQDKVRSVKIFISQHDDVRQFMK
jgi:selenocysteine lyase/cysteine desulfurase